MRADYTFDLEGLRSRQGQAMAILVAYDVRPEALEERRKRLAKLLSRKNKVMRDGIQLGEAITGDGAAIFRQSEDIHEPSAKESWAPAEAVRANSAMPVWAERPNACLAENEESALRRWQAGATLANRAELTKA